MDSQRGHTALKIDKFWRNTELMEKSWQKDNDGYHLMVKVKTWQTTVFGLDLSRITVGLGDGQAPLKHAQALGDGQTPRLGHKREPRQRN